MEPKDPKPSPIWLEHAIAFPALFLLVCLVLNREFPFPFTDNEGAFVLLGREMGHGARLYADLWDHKPPFYFGLSWWLQSFSALDPVSLHFFGAVLHALNGFLLTRIAKRMGLSDGAAIGTALAYVGLLASPLVLPWTVDADLLCLPFLLISFDLLLSEGPVSPLLSGLLFGAAFLTKQSVLFLCPVVGLVYGGQWARVRRWFIGAGGIVALTALYFAATDRWDDFSDALIRFNSIYVQTGWQFFRATAAFRQFLVQLSWMALAVYGIPLLLFIHGVGGPRVSRVPVRNLFFIGLWLLGALGAGCASGYFFTYYFVAVLPPLALGMGLAWQKWEEKKRLEVAFLSVLFTAGVLLLVLNVGALQDRVFGYSQYPTQRYMEDEGVGLALRAHAQPGDELLAWSDDPQLYVYSGLKPSLKTPFVNHLASMPSLLLQTWIDFQKRPPRFVLVALSNQVFPLPGPFRSYLKTHYTKVKSWQTLELYVLKTNPGLK